MKMCIKFFYDVAKTLAVKPPVAPRPLVQSATRLLRRCHIVGLVLCAVMGCVNQPRLIKEQPDQVDRSPYAEIYERTQDRFAHAVLYMPRGDGIDERFFNLAPLLMLELGDAQLAETGTSDPDTFDSRNQPETTQSIPTVYYGSAWTKINDQKHEQVSYFCVSEAFGTKRDGGPSWSHRIKLTLDHGGHPILAELFVSKLQSGIEIYFVSSSLELEARTRYGPPLPGRRYSIERSLMDSPNTIVAGVFEDGPIPMGPYIYLSQGGSEITTLHCRCSPSQVDEIVDTTYYEMIPGESLIQCGTALQSHRAQQRGETEPPSSDLPKKLRWPRGAD